MSVYLIPRFYVDGVHSPLSNFSIPSDPLVIDGHKYSTTEHYFQAMKTLDPDEQASVRACATPGQAKRAGRRVTLRPDWDSVKLLVMRRALAHKFTTTTGDGQYLLDTGDAILEEGNDWKDVYWGVDSNFGQNWLGHLLMARRAELVGALRMISEASS